MGPGSPVVAEGLYPERDETPEPFFDRLHGYLGFCWHRAFARRLPDLGAFAREVERHATRWAASPLPSRIPELRYALRRDGLRDPLIAECFGICGAALAGKGATLPEQHVLGAALLLLKGGLVEVADAVARRQAGGLAAATWAVCGAPVHLMVASDARAAAAAQELEAPLAAFGLTAGAITQRLDAGARRAAYASAAVCGTLREIAYDYLRDRALIGARSRPIARALQRVAGETSGKREPVMRGLHCALVDDADALMLDDVPVPLVLTSDVERPRERLVYEQAIELARALAADVDYVLEDEGVRLTDAGAQRVERLVGPLGGVWAARQRREDLMAMALGVLHRLEREVDYRVDQGRVTLLHQDPQAGGELAESDQTALRLIEVKEGCKLGSSPDVIARLSVPRFLRRYVCLAGICAGAGSAGEFWGLYRMKTTRAGEAVAATAVSTRLFTTSAARRTALVERVQGLSAAGGGGVVVALRTMAEAQALGGALRAAGVGAALLRGSGDMAEQQVLGQLENGSGVAILLYPGDRYLARTSTTGKPVSVLVGELHDARRHVERVCRVFAAPSCEMFLALQDEPVSARLGKALTRLASRVAGAGEEVPASRARLFAALAQRSAERMSTLMRSEVLSRDQQIDTLLAFSGKRE